jgi:hypothetical protein
MTRAPRARGPARFPASLAVASASAALRSTELGPQSRRRDVVLSRVGVATRSRHRCKAFAGEPTANWRSPAATRAGALPPRARRVAKHRDHLGVPERRFRPDQQQPGGAPDPAARRRRGRDLPDDARLRRRSARPDPAPAAPGESRRPGRVLVSMEDGEAIEIAHRASKPDRDSTTIIELGGAGVISDRDYRVTDVPLAWFLVVLRGTPRDRAGRRGAMTAGDRFRSAIGNCCAPARRHRPLAQVQRCRSPLPPR